MIESPPWRIWLRRPPASLRQSPPWRLAAALNSVNLDFLSVDDDGFPVDVEVVDVAVRHVEREARHVAAAPQVLVDVGGLWQVWLQVNRAMEGLVVELL